MSIPIKAQTGNVMDEWANVFMLVDGSLYGVDEFGTVHEFSRSYTGFVIKTEAKKRLTEYHSARKLANLAEKEGNLVEAALIRDQAEQDYKDIYLPVAKFWNSFKRMTTAKPRDVPDSRDMKAKAKMTRHSVRDKDGKFCPAQSKRPYRHE